MLCPMQIPKTITIYQFLHGTSSTNETPSNTAAHRGTSHGLMPWGVFSPGKTILFVFVVGFLERPLCWLADCRDRSWLSQIVIRQRPTESLAWLEYFTSKPLHSCSRFESSRKLHD